MIYTKANKEIAVASTKAFLGQVVSLTLLALLLVLTADSFFTVRLLRRTHNVDLLGLPNLLASLR